MSDHDGLPDIEADDNGECTLSAESRLDLRQQVKPDVGRERAIGLRIVASPLDLIDTSLPRGVSDARTDARFWSIKYSKVG
jgi:hypothetical protein